MIRTALLLIAFARLAARRRLARRRHRRDCWHPLLRLHASERWVFQCQMCAKPLNTRPIGAEVDE